MNYKKSNIKLRYFIPFIGIFLATKDIEYIKQLLSEDKYEAFFVYHAFVATAVCTSLIFI